MHKILGACASVIALLVAVSGYAQNRPAAQPQPAETINYDTIHLEKRLTAVRASGKIALDGVLDEPAWSEAPVANGFIQNDPREGTPATYDTDVRVLYTDDALYFGVWARDAEPSKLIVSAPKKHYSTGNSAR